MKSEKQKMEEYCEHHGLRYAGKWDGKYYAFYSPKKYGFAHDKETEWFEIDIESAKESEFFKKL